MQWRYERGALLAPLRQEVVDYVRWAAPGVDANAVKAVLGEILANVARHTASNAVIEFESDGNVASLIVFDNGPGYATDSFDLADETAESGRGLWLAGQFAADLRVELGDRGGTKVTAKFPVTSA